MRPIERGSLPRDKSGTPKIFSRYQDARGDLIDRLGEYCSYCEMPLGASLAVEHAQPKKKNPDLELSWDNFLLGCANCNSTKGDKDVEIDDYYWPDRDNTIRAFEYLQGGILRVNSNLTNSEKERARKTIELTGLNKDPKNDPARSDRRWLNRDKAWENAERALRNLQRNDTPEMREQIVDTATSRGFFSVWMTVFREDSDMLLRFIDAFPGTSRFCFDPQGRPIPRGASHICKNIIWRRFHLGKHSAKKEYCEHSQSSIVNRIFSLAFL